MRTVSSLLVPRPTICLNSVMEPTARSSTMRWHVWPSTPVERSREVVTRTGYFASGSMKFPSCACPSASLPVIRMTSRWFSLHKSLFSLIKACRIRAACSSSTQRTMVFWKASLLSLRKSDTFLATSLVRSSMTMLRSKSLVL